MSTEQDGRANGRAAAAAEEADPASELPRLRATCRRQAKIIGELTEAVATLEAGAGALKADNAEFRAMAASLGGGRRSMPRTSGREASAEVAIPLGVDAPRLARAVVGRCLAAEVPARVLHDAQLLVSELVTNSLRHSGAGAGENVVVRVHLWGDSCRLEVEDPGRGDAIAPPRQGEGGFGLAVVEALTSRWGVIRGRGGPTRVWGQLPSAVVTVDPVAGDGWGRPVRGV